MVDSRILLDSITSELDDLETTTALLIILQLQSQMGYQLSIGDLGKPKFNYNVLDIYFTL